MEDYIQATCRPDKKTVSKYDVLELLKLCLAAEVPVKEDGTVETAPRLSSP